MGLASWKISQALLRAAFHFNLIEIGKRANLVYKCESARLKIKALDELGTTSKRRVSLQGPSLMHTSGLCVWRGLHRQTRGRVKNDHLVVSANCDEDQEILRFIFSSKWRLKVLERLVEGPARLSELQRRVPTCSKKVMIDTLHGLERIAWVEKKEFVSNVRHVEYSLSASCADNVSRMVKRLLE